MNPSRRMNMKELFNKVEASKTNIKEMDSDVEASKKNFTNVNIKDPTLADVLTNMETLANMIDRTQEKIERIYELIETIDTRIQVMEDTCCRIEATIRSLIIALPGRK